jgi:hypothetical protein
LKFAVLSRRVPVSIWTRTKKHHHVPVLPTSIEGGAFLLFSLFLGSTRPLYNSNRVVLRLAVPMISGMDIVLTRTVLRGLKTQF